MNHFIYAKPWNEQRTAEFGSVSTPYLIKLMQTKGASLRSMKAHVAGGSQSREMNASIRVGERNVEMAFRVLKRYGIPVVQRDVQGSRGRKVIFDVSTGDIEIRVIQGGGVG
ncbi:MAG: chemotaxis protein CheD [Synergistales bacterium]|nr:chemotaxis protein CheD [Synergistales bacterium]